VIPGQISIVGFSGFISESYAATFLARVSTSDRRAHFFRGAGALECVGPPQDGFAVANSTPLCEQDLLPPGSSGPNDVRERWSTSEISNLLLNKSDHTCHLSLITGKMCPMKTFTLLITIMFAALIVAPSFAQSPAPALATSPTTAISAVAAAAGQPNPQEMMKQMVAMGKLNENHKLLSSMDGNWSYAIKMWMSPDPNAKPQESKGTATRKSVMGGRYVEMDVTGKMQMPDETGKMKDLQFKGMGVEGYDNVKQKFVASWIDNMGTGIQFSDGTYDPATKTLTYTSEIEMMPGMKTPVREVLKLTDKDHMMLEWYETHGGQEKKTMEIAYARAGKK